METLKIGIITIGIGLLSLIYPLTHIYLISLSRDLHLVWEKIVRKCKVNKYEQYRQRILNYQNTVRYILNTFFLSGLLFMVIFVILMIQSEERWDSLWTIILILIFILLAIFFTIYLSFSRRELIADSGSSLKWMTFGITIIFYIILAVFPFVKCLNQLYILLLWLGFLMVSQVFLWFCAGIKFHPLGALTEIRKKIYEEYKVEKSESG